MQDLIIGSLESLEQEFQSDELAYLALTTKIELPFRDRWAFSLYRTLKETYAVSREWKRTDMAILNGQSPEVLIELKAMYSFDAVLDKFKISRFADAMTSDAKKARLLAEAETEIYTVLLSTHPEGPFPPEMAHIVKYVSGINKAVNRCGSGQKVQHAAHEAINKTLRDRNVVATGSLDGGRAFLNGVVIDYWLVRA
ncbi:hypothetical protein CWE08_05370 [Aliidiomarina iranensis]|uniref:Uncharacterized protein n=1 Tax=Aliidiomarina iranensis TaxID=1434071 RepID=A0A432W0Q1_9GAMM|nr:hypothetical protein [Aliidiomarina iranensis]RUO22604.1 hypothetical protein CWE08_05370 [Aliidiomarina iranensis]